MNKIDNQNPISEGEEFLELYFDAERYTYESEKEIRNLKGDSKSYRVSDFYLTNYGVYVEFFGRWNHSKEERERYREKKNVYRKNNIPCIYLYPENLGVIDYIFESRLEQVLIEQKNKRGLLRMYIRDHEDLPRIVFWSFYLMTLMVLITIEGAIAGLIATYLIYRFYLIAMDIYNYKKNMKDII